MPNANEETNLEDNQILDETGNDEGDASEESEEQDNSEENGDDDSETITISKSELARIEREVRKDQDKRWKNRIKGQKGAEEGGEKEFDKEMIERTFIAVHAKVEDPEAQDEVIRLARKFGMTVAEAVKDADVKLRIENLQRQNKARQAIAGQTGSAKNNNRGIDYHVEQYKTRGVLPSDPVTIAKILEKLA